jgi:Glycosyl hydrolases family 15
VSKSSTSPSNSSYGSSYGSHGSASSRASALARLEQHGLIGERGHCALVAADGTIDWFAPDGSDQPPALYSLLNDAHGGRVQVRFDHIAPQRRHAGVQTADPHGAIITTQLSDGASLLDIEDIVDSKRIIRVLTMRRGEAEVVLDVVPGDRMGSARRVDQWSEGIAFGPIVVRGMVAGEPATMQAGDRRVITISRNDERSVTRSGPTARPLTVGEALGLHETQRKRWRQDLSGLEVGGPYRESALSAARSLRLLTNPTTGAIQRALTTSLPAHIGNERNLDERFAWIRDNAEAVFLWEMLGQLEWADQTRNWLHERAGDELPFATTYQLNGDRPQSEEEHSLPGWQGNGPVRVGSPNGSHLDLGAISLLSTALDDSRSWKELERIGDWLAENWQRRDQGFYDARTKGARHIESAMQTWRAFDALITTARRRNPFDPVTISWTEARKEIVAWLGTEGLFGIRPNVGWRRTATDDTSEASLLALLSREDFRLPEDAEDDVRLRMHATMAQTMAQLSEGPFVHRHLPHVDDGWPPGEDADFAASFRLVSALCRVERWEEAHARMESLLPLMGATAIGASHVDPVTNDLRGNLASAPTYLALIHAARDLSAGPA